MTEIIKQFLAAIIQAYLARTIASANKRIDKLSKKAKKAEDKLKQQISDDIWGDL